MSIERVKLMGLQSRALEVGRTKHRALDRKLLAEEKRDGDWKNFDRQAELGDVPPNINFGNHMPRKDPFGL